MTDRAVLDTRRLQLKDFYREVDPTREKNVDPLFGRYSFTEIATAVRNKYRKLPADWEWQLQNQERFAKHGSVNKARLLSTAEFYESASESETEPAAYCTSNSLVRSPMESTREEQPQDDMESPNSSPQGERIDTVRATTPKSIALENDTGLEYLSHDHEDMEKYHKMKKAGLPQGAVENCMVRDGVHPSSLYGDEVVTMSPLHLVSVQREPELPAKVSISLAAPPAYSVSSSRKNSRGLIAPPLPARPSRHGNSNSSLPSQPQSLRLSGHVSGPRVSSSLPSQPQSLRLSGHVSGPRVSSSRAEGARAITPSFVATKGPPPPIPTSPMRVSSRKSFESARSSDSSAPKTASFAVAPSPVLSARKTSQGGMAPLSLSPTREGANHQRTITPSFVARKDPPPPPPTSTPPPPTISIREPFTLAHSEAVPSEGGANKSRRRSDSKSSSKSKKSTSSRSSRKSGKSSRSDRSRKSDKSSRSERSRKSKKSGKDKAESKRKSSAPAPSPVMVPMKTVVERGSSSGGMVDGLELLSKDHDDMEKYKKMDKAGLPQGAVENCMVRDGVHPSSLYGHDVFTVPPAQAGENQMSSTQLSSPPPLLLPEPMSIKLPAPVPSRAPSSRTLDQKRMPSLEMPRKQTAISQAPSAAHDPTASGLELLSREHPDMEKYVKMDKAGLPQGAVENCMARDGVHPSSLYGGDVFTMDPAPGCGGSMGGSAPPSDAPSPVARFTSINLSKRQTLEQKAPPAKLKLNSNPKPKAKGGRGALLDDIVNRVQLVE